MKTEGCSNQVIMKLCGEDEGRGVCVVRGHLGSERSFHGKVENAQMWKLKISFIKGCLEIEGRNKKLNELEGFPPGSDGRGGGKDCRFC